MVRMLLFVAVALVCVISVADGASDASCIFQRGECISSGDCESGTYYQYGLCSGSKRCCVPYGSGGGDSHCEIRNGLCIPKDYGICTGKMAYYESGLCSGPRDRQCCLLQYKE